MKVSELGEFRLLEAIEKLVGSPGDGKALPWKQLITGIGDDAAVWRCNNPCHLATIDASVEGVHFTLECTPWEDLGWKSLAISLSDIAAMGGSPHYALISLTLPGHTEVDDVMALYRGMIEVAQRFGVAIIGGNISSAPLVMIDTVVLGHGQGETGRTLTRASAEAGDSIAVTGSLGGAAAGFATLTAGLKFKPAATASLREAFLRPKPRIAEGQFLLEKGVKTAIDISDGLVSDLGHICTRSVVGARVNVDLVPIHPAARECLGEKALHYALSGGEDYELLFTAAPSVVSTILREVSFPITIIGEIVADGKAEVALFNDRGESVKAPGSGWQHFAGSF
jgi:thiamine-monophosphate kinase